jgi:hypothetical protein
MLQISEYHASISLAHQVSEVLDAPSGILYTRSRIDPNARRLPLYSYILKLGECSIIKGQACQSDQLLRNVSQTYEVRRYRNNTDAWSRAAW